MPSTLLPVCFLGLLAFSSACYIQMCPSGGRKIMIGNEEDSGGYMWSYRISETGQMANPTANPTSKKCVDFFEGLRYQSHSQQKMRGPRRIFINCQEKRSTACAVESLHCVNENFLTSPCQHSLKPCQKWSRYSAPGLCCNEDKCARDLACRPAFDQSGGARDRSNATQLEEPICCR